ncbi:hypothetical protein [Pontibacter sp. G13]|uniref:hypothetical protein n=1 Tax=Pontibacter sp. G13 TaxID=3074898 RepID=UPI00288C295C|nr:hypothetical protein [Pontibacter sp. G13]WNJ20757.1 hypothetical protein RJD25_09765 [Pontibacter sp. G13]
MQRGIHIWWLAILLAMPSVVFSQLNQKPSIFPKAKITHKQGFTIKGPCIIDQGILIYEAETSEGSTFQDTLQIADLSEVQVAQRHYMFEGALTGLVLGAGGMILLEHRYELPRTGDWPDNLPWHASSIYESGPDKGYVVEMSFAPKLYLVTGCSLVGILVGMNLYKYKKLDLKKATNRSISWAPIARPSGQGLLAGLDVKF